VLGERVLRQYEPAYVPTSIKLAFARQYSIPIRDAIDIDHVERPIDGADEIDPAEISQLLAAPTYWKTVAVCGTA
jgi:ribose 5-phosphate isomerase